MYLHTCVYTVPQINPLIIDLHSGLAHQKDVRKMEIKVAAKIIGFGSLLSYIILWKLKELRRL